MPQALLETRHTLTGQCYVSSIFIVAPPCSEIQSQLSQAQDPNHAAILNDQPAQAAISDFTPGHKPRPVRQEEWEAANMHSGIS